MLMLKSPKTIGRHEVGVVIMKCNIYIYGKIMYMDFLMLVLKVTTINSKPIYIIVSLYEKLIILMHDHVFQKV